MKQKMSYYPVTIRSGSPFFADWYHAVVGDALANQGKIRNRNRYYHYFRSIPPELDSSYLLLSGVNFALAHLINLGFENEEVEDMIRLARCNNLKVTKEFVEFLETFQFTGNVWAVPEGQFVFPGEPTMIIEAPSLEALMPETAAIAQITYATLVATRASRVVNAAQGIPVAEFGARRSPNPMISTWASRVGGCSSTSNIEAARVYGIPISGTMMHAYVTMFEDEFDAFVAFYKSTGGNIFLIDTYDPIQGALNAIKAARFLGVKVMVRLDSGDPVELVPKIMALNAEGWIEGIILSDDMNIKKIDRIVKAGIKVKAFGVGTYIVVVPSASSVFKLTDHKAADSDTYSPRMKVSMSNPAKATLPGDFTIWRKVQDGKIIGDVIALRKEGRPGPEYEPVMVPVIKNGRLLNNLPTLREIYEFAQANLKTLPEEYARIVNPEAYPVKMSNGIERLRMELIGKAKRI